nr:hypothetical protein [Tanacetum cinerariifolium]
VKEKGQEIGEKEKVKSFWVEEIEEGWDCLKDKDVTLEEVVADLAKDAEVQGRQEEAQAQKQAQIEQDEAYAKELEAELNKNIN